MIVIGWLTFIYFSDEFEKNVQKFGVHKYGGYKISIFGTTV